MGKQKMARKFGGKLGRSKEGHSRERKAYIQSSRLRFTAKGARGQKSETRLEKLVEDRSLRDCLTCQEFLVI